MEDYVVRSRIVRLAENVAGMLHGLRSYISLIANTVKPISAVI